MTHLSPEVIAAMEGGAVALKNGTYTVEHPQQGHFTVKLHTAQKGGLAGKRILSLLTGPSNETDYSGVAFWDDEKRRAHVWSRWKGPNPRPDFPIDGMHWQERKDGWGVVEQKLSILLSLALNEVGFWRSEGYSLHVEGRCCVCNRKLTVPDSIRTGIGPECAKKSLGK